MHLYERTREWNEEQEKLVENFVDAFRASIFANADVLAEIENKTKVDDRNLEMAIYKAIAELNCTNKINLINQHNITDATKIIESVEYSAMQAAISRFENAEQKLRDMFPPNNDSNLF